MPAPKSLLKGAYMASEDTAQPRIITAVDGLDKSGKTHLAFSMPKPLVYLDFDTGKEGVIEQAIEENPLIITAKPFTFRSTEVTWGIEGDKKKAVMDAADAEWTRFYEMYMDALRDAVVRVGKTDLNARSLAIDTGGEAWEMLRYRELGKLTQVMPHHYGPVNSIMRDLVRAGFDHPVNVFWLHKLKSEWKDGMDGKGRKTGALERVGFKDMSYLVQGNLLCHRVPAGQTEDTTIEWKSGDGSLLFSVAPRTDDNDLGFRMVFGNCRQDPRLEGQMLFDDEIDFLNVAMKMRPDVDPSLWLSTEVE